MGSSRPLPTGGSVNFNNLSRGCYSPFPQVSSPTSDALNPPGMPYVGGGPSNGSRKYWAGGRLGGLPQTKRNPLETSPSRLGAPITISKGSFCASARHGEISKICIHIAKALRTNCLKPSDARTLRGQVVSTPPPSQMRSEEKQRGRSRPIFRQK